MTNTRVSSVPASRAELVGSADSPDNINAAAPATQHPGGRLRWEPANGAASSTGTLSCAIHSLKAFAKAHIRRIARLHQVSRVWLSPGLKDASHVVVLNVYNEAHRIDAFLDHHQSIGFDEFIVVDNRSTDQLRKQLEGRPGVSYFYADGDYRRARFGIDWVNGILSKYCNGKWILYADADEFLVYPSSDVRNIRMLTDHFERTGQQSMNTLMLDMYSEHPVEQNVCPSGVHPLNVCRLYDSAGYEARVDPYSHTTWIKGGTRGRVYFFDDIWNGPALNKTALVRWRRHYAFLKSTHEVWPNHLNAPSAHAGGKVSGALLHFKFLADVTERLSAESVRRQHTPEYAAYTARECAESAGPDLVSVQTARYETWRSLLRDHLIVSDGEWS
jgi:hypothetical protein